MGINSVVFANGGKDKCFEISRVGTHPPERAFWLPPRRRSDSAALNSAAISTQPATDFHVGISTPEFRPDDATLKYDVALRQLSLSSCPNPSRAISCSSYLVLLFPLCLDRRSSSLLKFVSRGVGILLGWWRSFNRVGWEYRQPLR